LCIAWVGDSQALLIVEKEPRTLSIEWMSRIHQPTAEDEKQRVLKSGGWVDQTKSGGVPIGPLRVYKKGEKTPGLMVTRSLGDADAHEVGVSAVPECYFRTLFPEDRYIVICSDGVWDVVNEHQVLKVVMECSPDMPKATKKIVQMAREGWKRIKRADNITCQIVMINFPESRVRRDSRAHPSEN